MKYLIIKSIFCPNQEFYENFIDSLIKLDFYINIEIDVLLIGYIGQFKEKLETFLKLFPTKFNIITDLFVLNYGKYYIFNKLFDYVINYDYFIYMDHDIIMTTNNFNEIINVNNNNIGLIAFNHKEDIRHQADIYSNIIEINNIKVCYPNLISSIACGCFAIECNKYLKMSKFDLISIYGLDDYNLLKKLENLGYQNIVFYDIFIIHPKTNNLKYNKWKYDMIVNLLNNKIEKYDRQIEENINILNDLF